MFFLLFFSATSVHLFSALYHCVVSCDQELYNSQFNDSRTCEADQLCPDCSDQTKELDYCHVDQNSGAFDHLWNSFITMFLAFTTENFPSIAFPAYDYKRGWMAYFILYIYVCIFFFEAILLGVIIDAYWVVSKEKIKRERQSERVNLAKAWNELLTTDDVQVVTEVRYLGSDIEVD